MTNKELVTKAITRLFIEKDASVLDEYWAENYIQHNPMFPSGREVLRGLLASMPEDFHYEMGIVIAEGDFVFVNGRYTGFAPKPMIACDVFKVIGGKIVEHWDTLQEEVLETASGNPMFPIK